MPIRNRDDLSLVYTPGVARVCLAIAENPHDARHLTIKRNCVAVVTDGTAVLGLGDIGPLAALPVMEGKAALFKRFAGIDAFPICLDTTDTEEIIATVKAIAPVFAGINLEDISAPRCFEIERRLRAELDIPVFHDDQHGTAIVVVAALTNALKVVRKQIGDVRIVDVRRRRGRHGGAQAAARGRRPRRRRQRHRRRACTRAATTWTTRAAGSPRTPTRAASPARSPASLAGADVFIGVSAPNVLTGDDVATMAADAVVFALANPMPEVDPAGRLPARRRGGHRPQRLRQPDQQRAGVPRASSAACSTPSRARITPDVLLAAATALAAVVGDDELNPTYIVPSVFHPDVTTVVADAVRKAVLAGGAETA